MKISVIVPTIGRPSLAATLESLRDFDEVLLVCDHREGLFDLPPLPDNVRVDGVRGGGDKGYVARERGMALATGTHLAFCDDDDVFAAGAAEVMRGAACDVPVIFKMDHPELGVLWRSESLVFGNVGTPMLLVPNEPGKLGEWVSYAPGLAEPGGDFTFIRQCVERMGEPVWREEVVAYVRPGVSLSIVTPWHNHPELWGGYERAVSVRRPFDEVVVVDDGSEPPLPFANEGGIGWMGFARASNLGLEMASKDAVLWLNNDIQAQRLDWLEKLRQAIEPGVLVGAQIRYDEHGSVDGTRLPYLDGWCIAGMREEMLALGGLDEGYEEPAYFSDNDFCLRARLEGMTLREVRVGLKHLLGATNGPATDPKKLRATEMNSERFAERARGMLAAA